MSKLHLVTRPSLFKRKFFYNDKLEIYRPFNNLVKLSFIPDHRIGKGDYHYVQRYFNRTFREEYGEVNGSVFLGSTATAFLNFSRPDDKRDALLRHNQNNDCLFSSTIEDFSIDGNHKDLRRPFKHILVACFRPTVHSPLRIQSYLSQFGRSFGQEIISCPYDKDRQFMYFCYHDRDSFMAKEKDKTDNEHKVAIPDVPLNSIPEEWSEDTFSFKEYIEGKRVSLPHLSLEELPKNRVYLYEFRGLKLNMYKPVIDVKTNQELPDLNLIKEYLGGKYGDIKNISHKGYLDDSEAEVEFANSEAEVEFDNSISSFRILYARTHYGKRTEDIPETDYKLEMTFPGAPYLIWRDTSLRLLGTPKIPDHHVMNHWNEFLDKLNCNPGIVGVSRMNDTGYELYFTNPWHTADVAKILVYNKRHHGYLVDSHKSYFQKWSKTGSKISRDVLS